MAQKDPNALASAALAKFKKSYQGIATSESTINTVIGSTVCSLLKDGAAVTEASILDRLQQQSATAPSHSGRVAPELDVQRMQAEAAIKHLRHLLGQTTEE
ncbi:hypothetical protein [Telmatospirillum sp. J64-1]|uniref:hypothetical protein n=1 Tax=Telmatospirillum sp. J64-1 TaxID=2502183 RepID=UPI00115E7D1B|nr:hypothetical protein [Telmatospirillum sp. J64-1]